MEGPALDRAVSNMPDDIALPRQNGELHFDSPWEARAFGIAVALNECGAFPWQVFSRALAHEISAAERSGETSTYYDRWLRALRRVTTGEGFLDIDEIVQRTELARQQAEHDHDHSEHHHD